MGEDRKEVRTIIVCSLNDPAGTNIRERLIDNYPFKETEDWFDSSPVYSMSPDILLVSSQKGIVFVDGLDEKFGGTPENTRYLFISKHRAESGIPSLTAHFTGNFGPAEFGGKPSEVARYSASLLKNYMLTLNSRRGRIPQQYNITLEATHHGPTSLESTVLFVELGSTEAQWVDQETAQIIAESVMDAINSKNEYQRCAIGIGGTHYPEKLNNVELESDMALGVVVPKYSLQYLDAKLLEQILEKSDQTISTALVELKGLGKFKERVLALVRDVGLEKADL